jgi:hypothetical protein
VPGALVGNVGAIATGTTTVTPAFGQATTAGHLLVARVVFVGNATVATVASGWVQALKVANGTAVNTAIWYKPNSGASETAPTFTVASGTYLAADLSEWSGVATTSPLDQTGSGTGSGTNPFVQNNTADATSGDVQIGVVGTSVSKAATVTFTDGWSPAATPTGSAHGTGATSATKHAWLTANIGDGNTGFNSVGLSATSTWAMVIATFAPPPVAPTAPQTVQIANADTRGNGSFVVQGSGQLEVIWRAPTQGTSLVYDVHQSLDQSTWTTVQTGTTNTFYQATGLTNGTTYYYYITARNSVGSADSTTVSSAPKVFTRSNGFEGGTPGSDFRTSNPVPVDGNAWDAQSAGGTYIASPTAHGSVALQSGNNTTLGWWYVPGTGPGTTLPKLYLRIYFQFQGTTFTYDICQVQDTAAIRVFKAGISAGVLGIYDASNTAAQKNFTTALSINTWYRLEAVVTGNANTAPVCRLYTSMDSTTITETVTPTTGTWYNGASLNYFTTSGSSSGAFTIVDDVGLSEVDWLGPYVPPATGGGVVPTEGGTGLRVISKWR